MWRSLLSLLVFAVPGLAQVHLASYFGDSMVLQRDRPVRVWGSGTPGAALRAGLGDHSAATTVSADGGWSLELAPLTASFEEQTLWVESGGERSERVGVLLGDVWVCGGQSNMEWTLRGTRDADVEIDSADSPHVRFLRLPKVARLEAQDDFPAQPWLRCVAPEVANCTGVGYYFARRLSRRLQVPIGLVDVSWGGTMAQHWVRSERLREVPEMAPYFTEFETSHGAWIEGGGEDGAARRLAADVAAWEQARVEAQAAGEREPGRPNPKAYEDPATHPHPGGMANGMIHPIAQATITGVLFYQGENNSFGESWKPFYATFPAVIEDWRAQFGRPDLPFGIIQIAGWSTRRSMTYDMNHHTNVVREVQFDTWRRSENTGLIVTFDTNSSRSIHPGRKQPVGERAARWALAEVHGVKQPGKDTLLEWRGPVYASSRIEAGKVVVEFEEETARGLVLDQDEDAGFYIAGEDQVFQHAQARVDGARLLVWSDAVSAPVAVRYGWSNLPAGGLMNGRELPAYPFRTDGWPMTPHQSTGSYVRSRD